MSARRAAFGGLVALAASTGCVQPADQPSDAPASDAPASDTPGVGIEYIAHASFIIESPRGTRVLLDPYADSVWLGYTFPRGLDYDAIAITHPHYDHDGGEFRELEVPWPAGTPVYRDAGEQRIGDVRLIGVAAKHADPYGMEFGQKNVVWIIEVGDVRIAHIGDNGPLGPEVVERMGAVDVLMLPIDGEQHILTYEQVDAILNDVAPRVVIPMHYRLPQLEPGDGPSDLGPIDPWIDGRAGVTRLDGNVWRLGSLREMEPGSVVVFHPSPAVPRPAR